MDASADNMDLAVGQGDLLTDPLQMAVAYSTLANAYMQRRRRHGRDAPPRQGRSTKPTAGSCRALELPPAATCISTTTDLNLVMEGIHEAASEPGGTSADVWTGWNQAAHPVYGKTGTAEHAGQEDQSWYMCYVGDPKHPIVIAVTVEQGGFGAETAAPIARLMASQWFGVPEKFVAGSSKTLLSPLSPIKPSDEAPATPPRTLRLPLDPLLTLAVIGLGVCSVVTLGAGHAQLRARQSPLLRRPPGDLPGDRLRLDARALPPRLLTPAPIQKRDLRRS